MLLQDLGALAVTSFFSCPKCRHGADLGEWRHGSDALDGMVEEYEEKGNGGPNAMVAARVYFNLFHHYRIAAHSWFCRDCLTRVKVEMAVEATQFDGILVIVTTADVV